MDDLPIRDIHLPASVSWWPPAIGWWLLLLAALLLAGALWLWRRRQHRQRRRKQALHQLQALRAQAGQPLACVQQISQWLRQVAVNYYPRQQVAALQGETWLAFLDQNLADQPFQNGAGRCLLDAPYRPQLATDIDLNALFDLCERWLKQLPETRR